MNASGSYWIIITVVGAIVLAAAIAWAMLNNRSSRAEKAESERATRRVYEEENRAHAGESDKVP